MSMAALRYAAERLGSGKAGPMAQGKQPVKTRRCLEPMVRPGTPQPSESLIIHVAFPEPRRGGLIIAPGKAAAYHAVIR